MLVRWNKEIAEELNINEKFGFHKRKLKVFEIFKLYSKYLFYFTMSSLRIFFFNPFFLGPYLPLKVMLSGKCMMLSRNGLMNHLVGRDYQHLYK